MWFSLNCKTTLYSPFGPSEFVVPVGSIQQEAGCNFPFTFKQPRQIHNKCLALTEKAVHLKYSISDYDAIKKGFFPPRWTAKEPRALIIHCICIKNHSDLR